MPVSTQVLRKNVGGTLRKTKKCEFGTNRSTSRCVLQNKYGIFNRRNKIIFVHNLQHCWQLGQKIINYEKAVNNKKAIII